jgi:hypothetical protein
MLGFLKWGSLAAALALFALAGLAIRNAHRIGDVMLNGAETAAVVDGGRTGVREATGGTYAVDLVWRDAGGAEHTSRGLAVGGVLGRQLIAGEAGDPPTLMIKYLAGRKPVIIRQAALDQETNQVRTVGGLVGGGVLALLFVILAWVGRRRPASATP